VSKSLAPNAPRTPILRYVAAIGCWILFAAGAGWLVWVARIVLFELAVAARLNPWAVRAIDLWAIFLLALVWLVAILILEGLLRSAVKSGRLRRMIVRLLIVELSLAAVLLIANFVLTGAALP
jgi:hypothetical protein